MSPTHEERLTVPWHWWVATLAISTGLAGLFGVGALGVPGWLVASAGLALAAGAGLWWLGRIRVAVGGGELIVDDARLPLRFVAGVVPLDPAGRRELLGPGADPLGFVVQRPWVPGAVQVLLDDPADPTPYWLISTRHPERLAAALGRRPDPPGAGAEASLEPPREVGA